MRRLLAFTAALAIVAGTAHAQSGADRRLDRVERDLKTLQSIVLQAQATGQPVVVRPEGADPAVTALSSRVDDLEMTLQRINGQVENLGHDLETARRTEQAAQAERTARDKLLEDRLGRIEAQLTALAQAAAPVDQAAAGGPDPGAALGTPPPPGVGPRGQPGADATTRAQAQDGGVLGGRAFAAPPPPPPAPPAGPNEAFAAARQLQTSGQQAAATDALQDFVTRYPNNARTPEAFFYLGEAFYAQKGYQNAVAAYASALRNRPTTTWAPGAMVKLAQALNQSGQDAQACAALTEYDQRYAARAAAAVKTNAAAIRRRAHCG